MTSNKPRTKWITKDILNWSLFDFGNSAFATIIVAFVYAIYFKKIVALNQPIGDFLWSLAINVSMLLVAFLSPVLGASADYYSNKKRYLLFFTLLCIISTSLMYFIGAGMLFWGMLLFIFANIGFQAGLGFYDAFIKELTSPVNYNKMSSLGYAVGYLGSLSSLGVVILFQNNPHLTFVSSAMLFLFFSLPFFIFVKEQRNSAALITKKSILEMLLIGFKRTVETLRHLKSYRNLKIFLLSYFLYIDGVNTIIFFSANFAQTTLNFTIQDLILFFIVVQITALIGSFLFGWIADRTGTLNTLISVIIGWIIVTVAVFFCNDKITFIIIGGFAGTFLGSSQALSRSLMSNLTPTDKKTEFFGFYSLFEKTSTILGPFTFGFISWIAGNQRLAVISIIIFFIAGVMLLLRVKEYKETNEIS